MSSQSAQVSQSQDNLSSQRKLLFKGYITCSHCQLVLTYYTSLSLIQCPKCLGFIKVTYTPTQIKEQKSNKKELEIDKQVYLKLFREKQKKSKLNKILSDHKANLLIEKRKSYEAAQLSQIMEQPVSTASFIDINNDSYDDSSSEDEFSIEINRKQSIKERISKFIKSKS